MIWITGLIIDCVQWSYRICTSIWNSEHSQYSVQSYLLKGNSWVQDHFLSTGICGTWFQLWWQRILLSTTATWDNTEWKGFHMPAKYVTCRLCSNNCSTDVLKKNIKWRIVLRIIHHLQALPRCSIAVKYNATPPRRASTIDCSWFHFPPFWINRR